MATLHFILTYDGHKALTLPGITFEPEQTQPQNLRAQLFKRTGIDALVLHDGGLQLGLNRERYDVRMEALSQFSQPSHLPETRYSPVPGARTWQQPGWFKETLGWLEHTLGETITSLEQYSTYDLACVFQITTATQTMYLKASETGLEAAVCSYVSSQLAATHPGLLPRVILSDTRRALLVTKGCGLRLNESADIDVWATALRKLAYFHKTAGRQGFQTLGCPVYGFDELAERTVYFLQDTDALRGWGLEAEQIRNLSGLAARILQAHKRVSALELPLCPTHGDAHPMNALSGCGTVWFDWSEASITHPFLDSGWFLAWVSHPARRHLPLLQAHPNAATELWRVYLQALAVPETVAPPLLADATLLALAHRSLEYHAKFRGWRGTVPGWRPGYVPYYLRCLLKLPL